MVFIVFLYICKLLLIFLHQYNSEYCFYVYLCVSIVDELNADIMSFIVVAQHVDQLT